MFPLLPFAAGLAAGILGVQMLRNVKTGTLNSSAREQLGRAKSGLRNATVSSLEAIEHSTANLRAKLTPEPAPAAEPDAAESTAEPAAEAAAPSAPAKARAPRKTTRKKAAPKGGEPEPQS